MPIFPDVDTAAGVVIRDAEGNPTNPEGVSNAYSPLPAFVSTCLITALPTDCEARIEPKQINAIVSELLSFAECLDPNGTWDCASLKNLCNAFVAWALINSSYIYVDDEPPPDPIVNKLWWENDTGNLYIYYDDGNSQQWVQINATNTVVMDQVSIVGAGSESSPHMVELIDCGSY